MDSGYRSPRHDDFKSPPLYQLRLISTFKKSILTNKLP